MVDTFLDSTWFALPASYQDPYALANAAAQDSTPSFFNFDSESAPASCQEHRSDGVEAYEEWPTPASSDFAQSRRVSPTCNNRKASFHSQPNLYSAAAGLDWASPTKSAASSPSPSGAAPPSSGNMSYNFSQRAPASPSSSSTKQDHRQARKRRTETSQELPRRSPSNLDVKAKAAHTVVERRYRDKLNDKMMQLHQALTLSKLSSGSLGDSTGLSDSSVSTSKTGKAEVMTKAIQYVDEAELQMQNMRNEIKRLHFRVSHLESVVSCGQNFLSSQSMAAF